MKIKYYVRDRVWLKEWQIAETKIFDLKSKYCYDIDIAS